MAILMVVFIFACYVCTLYYGASPAGALIVKQNDHIKCILCTGVPIMDVESKGGGPGMYVRCMARWNNKK